MINGHWSLQLYQMRPLDNQQLLNSLLNVQFLMFFYFANAAFYACPGKLTNRFLLEVVSIEMANAT